MTDPSMTDKLLAEVGHVLAVTDVSAPAPVDGLFVAAEQRGRRQRAWIVAALGMSAVVLAGLVVGFYGGGSSGESVRPALPVPAAGQQRPLVGFLDLIPTLIGDIWVSTLVTFVVFAAIALLIRRLRQRTVARPVRPLDKVLLGVAAGLIVFGVGARLSLQMYFITEPTMEPSIEASSRVLVALNDTDVDVGDVIIHRLSAGDAAAQTSFIKRVVAIGGDEVQATDGHLLINGEPSSVLTIDPARPIGDFGPVQVPTDEYFVMGDNYPGSSDSRHHGPVGADVIEGTVRWSMKGWRG